MDKIGQKRLEVGNNGAIEGSMTTMTKKIQPQNFKPSRNFRQFASVFLLKVFTKSYKVLQNTTKLYCIMNMCIFPQLSLTQRVIDTPPVNDTFLEVFFSLSLATVSQEIQPRHFKIEDTSK